MQADPFAGDRFFFSPEVHSGEVATVRGADGSVRLTYRSFSSMVGLVALVVAAIVLFAGIAATLFLVAEGRPSAAAAAAILSLAFSGVIAGMVPAVRTTLYDGTKPILTISQRSRFTFPYATYAVTSADGQTLALVKGGVLAQLGRSRWRLLAPASRRPFGDAIEESLASAIVRKLLGKFNKTFQSNLRVRHENVAAGEIVRRPDQDGQHDYLRIEHAAGLDHRVAIALAVLVFGSET